MKIPPRILYTVSDDPESAADGDWHIMRGEALAAAAASHGVVTKWVFTEGETSPDADFRIPEEEVEAPSFTPESIEYDREQRFAAYECMARDYLENEGCSLAGVRIQVYDHDGVPGIIARVECFNLPEGHGDEHGQCTFAVVMNCGHPELEPIDSESDDAEE